MDFLNGFGIDPRRHFYPNLRTVNGWEGDRPNSTDVASRVPCSPLQRGSTTLERELLARSMLRTLCDGPLDLKSDFPISEDDLRKPGASIIIDLIDCDVHLQQKKPVIKSLAFNCLMRRDRDSNSGTKILGHSLAGCCITTLPPLQALITFSRGCKFRQSDCLNKEKVVSYRFEICSRIQPNHPIMKKVLILSVFAFFALAASAQSTTAEKGGQATVEQSNGGKSTKAATASTRYSSLGVLQPAPATEPSEEGKQKEAACHGEGKSKKGACCSGKGKTEGGACCSGKGKAAEGKHGEKSGCAGSEKERAHAEGDRKGGSCCAGKSAGASCSDKAHAERDRKE